MSILDEVKDLEAQQAALEGQERRPMKSLFRTIRSRMLKNRM